MCGLLIAGVLGTFGLLYMLKFAQSVRISGMNNARVVLKQAYLQFLHSGTVEPNGTAKPFVFTNIVTVDDVSYQCAVGVAVDPPEERMLALSTNGVFVLLDRKSAPKIIPVSGYVPPLFPESRRIKRLHLTATRAFRPVVCERLEYCVHAQPASPEAVGKARRSDTLISRYTHGHVEVL